MKKQIIYIYCKKMKRLFESAKEMSCQFLWMEVRALCFFLQEK